MNTRQLGYVILLLGILLLILGGAFSPVFLSVGSIVVSMPAAKITATGLTEVQEGSIVAGVILAAIGIWLVKK